MPTHLLQILDVYKKHFIQISIICAIQILILFIQIGTYFYLNGVTLAWLINSGNLLTVFLFFIFFYELYLILICISSFIVWLSAIKLNGKGTYPHTTLEIVLTILYTSIPFGFCFVCLQFDVFEGFLHNLSCIVIVLSLIYGFGIICKKLSIIHNISFDRASVVFLLGGLLQASIMVPLISFIYTSMRTLYIVLLPPTMQILTTILVIFCGAKIISFLKNYFQSSS